MEARTPTRVSGLAPYKAGDKGRGEARLAGKGG